ncbi:phospholipase-like protein [Tanacetum coccineum]
MEKLLNRVQLHKGKEMLSESMKYAMRPIIEALVAKQLLRHPDMNVNISVACCICDVLRIMNDNAPYNDEQMKDFFELAVITFEKLSGGCSTKLFKVLRTLSHLSYSLLKSDLLLKGLIVRIFKQFLTSADSNSSGAVSKMKQIMIIIIEQSKLLDRELVNLLVTSVKKENQITSPVCWKLGDEVLKKCAAKLEPHLPDQVAKEECNSLRESVQPVRSCKDATTHTVNLLHIHSEVEKNHENETLSSHDPPKPSTSVIEVAKEECNSLRESVQPVRSCKDATTHTVNLLHIHSEVEKNHENETFSSHDPPIPSTSVIEVSSDDDNEELKDLTGKQWELLENVSAKPDSVSFDNGDESLVDIVQENCELVENVAHSVGQAPPASDIISVQGYSVKQSIATTLEAIFKKHGDILADCFYQTASVRTYFLEVICEVSKLLETSDVTTIISKMEEIDFQVSEADAANIDVSWLQAQLDIIRTRNEALKKNHFTYGDETQERCVKAEECIKVLDKRADLVEDKPISTIISKRAARADMRERCRERVVAQEEFEKAERCVTVLDLVEKKLSKDILESQEDLRLSKIITSLCYCLEVAKQVGWFALLTGQMVAVKRDPTIDPEKDNSLNQDQDTTQNQKTHLSLAKWFFKAGDTGLSTFKRSGAGEREAHKIGKSAFKGGVTSLKVYNEEEKDKIGCGKEGR